MVLDNLTAGNHTVVVKSPGNENYTAIENSTMFEIPKADPAMDVTVTGSVPGEDVVVTVDVGPDATGTVTIVVDGVEHTVPVDENGTATYVIPDAQPGNHTVTAKYWGDDNFNEAETPEETVFTVDKFDVTVGINDTIIDPNNNVTVVVQVNESDAEGSVTITLPNGDEFTAPVENGIAYVNVGVLDPDTTHVLNVTYSGDDRYNEAVNNTGSIEVPKLRNSTIDVEITPRELGENTTITVTVPEDFDGNVTVIIDGVEYPVEIDENGTGVLNVTPAAGNHTVQVKLNNSDKYADNETEPEDFTVPATDNYGVEIDVQPGKYGENTTITVTVPPELRDNVTVTIDGVEYPITIDENGTGVLNVSSLPAGDHDIKVTTDGDENYTAKENSTEFEIPKQTPDMDVVINPVDVGETAVVDVTVPEDATGYIYVNVNGTEYSAPIENGHATVEIPNLGDGAHDVVVTYGGDENYTGAKENDMINVSKVEADIAAKTSDIALGEDAVVTVTVPEDATGTVTVTVGDITKTVPVSGGVNEIAVPGVPVGDHDVVVTYNGDDKYAPENTTASLNVAPAPTSADDIKVDDKGDGTVVVTVPENATGNVTITLPDGSNITAPVEDGKAVFNLTNLTDLAPGEHNISVAYSGDENHTAAEVNATATIPKLPCEVSANSPTIREGDEANVYIEVNRPDATDLVLVNINGVGYYANVTDGKATVTVPGLTEGVYDVEVIYLGDKNYNECNTTTSLTVQPPITVDIESGENSELVINVPKDGVGDLDVLIDGEPYAAVVGANGTVKIPIDNLTPGPHNLTVTYTDSDGTQSTVDSVIIAPKWKSSLEATSQSINVGQKEPIAITGPSGYDGDAVVNLNGIDYHVYLTDGKGKLNVEDLAAGEYTAEVSYMENDMYLESSTTTSFVVSKADIDPNEDAQNDNGNLDVGVVLPDDATGTLTVNVDGTDYVFPAKGGLNNMTIGNLTNGPHEVNVTYSGDDKYNGFNESKVVNVTRKPIATVIEADRTFTRVATDYYAGERGGIFYGYLKDTDGNLLANKLVQVAVNGPIYNITTDEYGRIPLQINLMNRNVYTYALFFQGDETYNATKIASSKLTIVEKDTSISASDMKFKKSAKNKVVKVTLKTIKNPYDGKTYLKAGKKLTLKVNGKTYKAKTNNKGVAKFNIKLDKKGIFTAKIKFKGDKTYKASSKKIKITVK